jgi:hypothetical protein
VLTILAQEGAAEKKLKEYETGIEKYEDKGKETMEAAKKFEEQTEHTEAKALYFDMGEGLLEIGLVLSSLYFISRKMLFPVIGVIAGLGGIAVAAMGLMAH